MAKTKTPKHIHKYILVKSNRTNMWKCAIAGCTHLMYAYLHDALIGRFSLCNTCGKQYILEEKHLDVEYPKCNLCVFGIGEVDDMDELLKEMGLSED